MTEVVRTRTVNATVGQICYSAGEAKSLLRSLGCRGLVVWCLEDSEHAYQFFQGAGSTDIAEGMEDFGDKHLKKVGFVWN